ncbi:uncharacterized protein CLUP02_04496 [Colletotrichum lupini]|uniref:Uncharacterized protein n=1 Tax=Colletotrichum lupini TaxID=145971 RepID=A0A9Q8SKF3_9PEZI|nr:uncharacterized protein CLUP02_04496 [Colletotrichum lupini]UQC79017.1 hypothetical protein CLUP02_04496 [Colletotrichum lupini]
MADPIRSSIKFRSPRRVHQILVGKNQELNLDAIVTFRSEGVVLEDDKVYKAGGDEMVEKLRNSRKSQGARQGRNAAATRNRSFGPRVRIDKANDNVPGSTGGDTVALIGERDTHCWPKSEREKRQKDSSGRIPWAGKEWQSDALRHEDRYLKPRHGICTGASIFCSLSMGVQCSRRVRTENQGQRMQVDVCFLTVFVKYPGSVLTGAARLPAHPWAGAPPTPRPLVEGGGQNLSRIDGLGHFDRWRQGGTEGISEQLMRCQYGKVHLHTSCVFAAQPTGSLVERMIAGIISVLGLAQCLVALAGLVSKMAMRVERAVLAEDDLAYLLWGKLGDGGPSPAGVRYSRYMDSGTGSTPTMASTKHNRTTMHQAPSTEADAVHTLTPYSVPKQICSFVLVLVPSPWRCPVLLNLACCIVAGAFFLLLALSAPASSHYLASPFSFFLSLSPSPDGPPRRSPPWQVAVSREHLIAKLQSGKPTISFRSSSSFLELLAENPKAYSSRPLSFTISILFPSPSRRPGRPSSPNTALPEQSPSFPSFPLSNTVRHAKYTPPFPHRRPHTFHPVPPGEKGTWPSDFAPLLIHPHLRCAPPTPSTPLQQSPSKFQVPNSTSLIASTPELPSKEPSVLATRQKKEASCLTKLAPQFITRPSPTALACFSLAPVSSLAAHFNPWRGLHSSPTPIFSPPLKTRTNLCSTHPPRSIALPIPHTVLCCRDRIQQINLLLESPPLSNQKKPPTTTPRHNTPNRSSPSSPRFMTVAF